ncbi:hypothetical protein C8J57DRAFT_1545099 [Mycena rebaudengoi]|nr:hypothetical protein C8J57DRAFT_1545099 [Mycena rebaudengoi]
MLERAAASPNLPTATEAHYVRHAEVGTSRRAGGRRRTQCVIRRGGTMRNGRDRDALKAFADKSARDFDNNVAGITQAKKNKLFKLTAQVELLKAEIDTLNQNLVEVTKSEQKFVQAQVKLKKKYQKQKNIRSDLQRRYEELEESNQELTVTLNKKLAAHADLQRQCEGLTEKNQELIIVLSKKPALPPNGPSAAKWRERCEKLQEQYQTLQLCYKRLKTELQELKEAYRGFVFVDFRCPVPPMPRLKPSNLLSLLFLKQGDLGFPDGNLFSQSLEPCALLCGREVSEFNLEIRFHVAAEEDEVVKRAHEAERKLLAPNMTI